MLHLHRIRSATGDHNAVKDSVRKSVPLHPGAWTPVLLYSPIKEQKCLGALGLWVILRAHPHIDRLAPLPRELETGRAFSRVARQVMNLARGGGGEA